MTHQNGSKMRSTLALGYHSLNFFGNLLLDSSSRCLSIY